MGSFSDLYIDSFCLFSSKNNFYEDAVEAIYIPNNFKVQEINEDEEIYCTYTFESEAKDCISRLQIFGATKEKAKADFYVALKESDLLGISMTYEEYESFIKRCISENYNSEDIKNGLSTNERFLLGSGFSIGQPTCSLLFTILSVINSESSIVYDLSSLINNGYVQENIVEILNFKKIIILTEGRTDTKYIKKSISLLYPHLSFNYHFMDFGGLNLNGGASSLVYSVKSFIGSGIKNKIIALFDNDTAGLKEKKILEKIDIPTNIKVLAYPDIKLAEEYPTLGPTGKQVMNVNGLSCSIEMYLGSDILKNESGEYIPIQWKGFERSMNAYQGEILEKKLIQDRFELKLKKQKEKSIKKENWLEMNLLLETIKTAWD